MANRNSLHVNKLNEFKSWLTADGWNIESPKGDYEVLRAKKPGKRPLIVYTRSTNNLVHYTVPECHTGVLGAFLKSKRREGRGVNQPMTEKRKKLLERLSNFRTVPGHGPDINFKTDEELELYVNLLESMFERAFGEEGGD